jgi:putative hydrolase of the HAD superfamily
MIRAVLFDMGGTLDGDGLHWLDRFAALYAGAGLRVPRDRVRDAFDEAERLAAADEAIATAHLDAMVARHVGWQLAHLAADPGIRLRADGEPDLAPLARRVADGFVAPIRATADANVRVLAELAARGLKLGVVSNGCGNVDVLCADLGYAPYLSAIVDSRRVGLYKPDPAIFIYAAARLGVPPADVLMVGDSFDRDIRPARSAGMTTAWLEGAAPRECPDPSLVDLRLRRLADLRAALAERTVA